MWGNSAQSEVIPQAPFLPPQWVNELSLTFLMDAVFPLQCGSVGRTSPTRVHILPWRPYLGCKWPEAPEPGGGFPVSYSLWPEGGESYVPDQARSSQGWEEDPGLGGSLGTTQNMNEILSFVSSTTGESTGLGERAQGFWSRALGGADSAPMTQTNLWTVGILFKQSVSCLSVKSGTVVAAVVEERNDVRYWHGGEKGEAGRGRD